MLFLAQGDPTFHLSVSTLVTLGGIVAGVAGTLAVLKFRSSATEDKQKDQEKTADELKAKDVKIEESIQLLNEKFKVAEDLLSEKITDLERRQMEKSSEFQLKMSERFEKFEKDLSDHERRLAVAENDREHMKQAHQRVARKVTILPGELKKP